MTAADTDLDALFKRLHLANARRVWRDLVQRAEQETWTYADFLALLISEEIAHRQQTRLARLTRRAQFPFLKTIDDFNFTYQSSLRLQMLGSALSVDFVTEGRSLILAGKPGRGKTHLAIAMAYRAIQNGFDAFFTTAAALIDDLSAAFRAGELAQALPTYTHPAVLVVDEVGYLTYGTDAANMLFHVVNERHRRHRSMIFTTNKSLKAWGRVLHDEDLAQAIIDRVLERGRILRLDGPSVRTLHVNLDEAMKEESDQQADLVRISGKIRSEFPEPTIGIDVGGRVSKGYDLCRLVWSKGVPVRVFFERLPHTCPLPPTASLRACVAQGDLQQFAALTHASASETAANLWEKLTRVTGGVPAGVFIDSPSAFSRNVLGHGRLTEKQSIRGVSFQSTPSICCGAEHGGDWGWLVYGMVAFAACLYRGALCEQQWLAALEEGLFAPLQKARLIAREVFPTATIARLRAAGRSATVQGFLEQLLGADAERAAVRDYLTSGVWAVKVPGRDVFDRADALVAALSSVPYMSNEVAEAKWPDPTSVRWHSTVPDAHLAEGTIALPC